MIVLLKYVSMLTNDVFYGGWSDFMWYLLQHDDMKNSVDSGSVTSRTVQPLAWGTYNCWIKH